MPTKETAANRDGVRQYLIHLADEGHPIDIEIVEKIGQFPTSKAAAVWLQRQEAGGKLKCVGTRENRQGRKVQKYYCNSWEPKEDNGRHEIIGTWYCILFPLFQFQRGHRIGGCYADLVQTSGNNRWEVEIDCGTIRDKSKMLGRMKKHADCDCDLLFVIATKNGKCEERLQRIMQWYAGQRDGLFYTTLERLEKHGAHAPVWDYEGRGEGPFKRVPLPVWPTFQQNTGDTPESQQQ